MLLPVLDVKESDQSSRDGQAGGRIYGGERQSAEYVLRVTRFNYSVVGEEEWPSDGSDGETN